MRRFATLPAETRNRLLTEVSLETGIAAAIIEKDFWVCWMLGLLFDPAQPWGEAMVFKGGTALSKVFGAIRRFSEDIDLSVAPCVLGMNEAEMEPEVSRRQRDRWMEGLEAACAEWSRGTLAPALEASVRAELGSRPEGPWLEFKRDAASHSPVLLFHYPCTIGDGLAYIRRNVKLEFGSLTDQRPTGRHTVRPWLSAVVPAAAAALREVALRQRVVDWKAKFFARSWARYDLAVPGTFRLVPPDSRLPELERDYAEMRQMFLDDPAGFPDIMAALRNLEQRINQGP
jgi:hypothetical protein